MEVVITAAVVILLIAWFQERSGMRKTFLKKTGRTKALKKLESVTVEDSRVEFYKTLNIVCISLFWLLPEYDQIMTLVIILINIVAFIRHLRYPDRIHVYIDEAGHISALTKMFLMTGINLSFIPLFITSLSVSIRLILLTFGLAFVIFIVYFIRCRNYISPVTRMLPLVVPALIFSFGCIVWINFFYDARSISKVDTVVEQVHIGMRTGGISIPELDAVEGKTYFIADVDDVEKGDKVKIRECIGCLGIKWITVRIE